MIDDKQKYLYTIPAIFTRLSGILIISLHTIWQMYHHKPIQMTALHFTNALRIVSQIFSNKFGQLIL